MEIIAPDYYNDFHCLAAACPDSCCKEWDVEVDDAAARMYRALPGPLGDRLRTVLREEDGSTVMAITDGRCPMWRQDGLCQIQAELGHDALCHVCRTFPRLTHDYGDFIELGLELSCPEAARLILSSPTRTLSVQTLPGGEPPEYDQEAMAILRASRQPVLDFLEKAEYPMPQTLAITLLYAHSVQSALDGGEETPFNPPECLAKAKQFAKPSDMHGVIAFFQGLEILTPQWRDRLRQPFTHAPCAEALRPLARYFVERYWLQAVSDYDLIGRVKFALIACLLINALGEDLIATAQLFSKEIENSTENTDAILDGVYTCPAFTDTSLLGLLLGISGD